MKNYLLPALIYFVFQSFSFAQSDWQWLNPKPSGSDIVDMTFISENALDENHITYPLISGVNLSHKSSHISYSNEKLKESNIIADDFYAEVLIYPDYIKSFEAKILCGISTKSSQMTNIKLEYGYSEESRKVVAAKEPTLAPNSGSSRTFDIKDLKSGTKYWCFVSFDYNGKRQTSPTVYFTTRPEAEILFTGPAYYGSRTARFTAQVISNLKSIKDITFEYGKDSLFNEQIKGKPDSVQALQTKQIQADVSNLIPGTYYRVRLRVKYNNQMTYSQTIGFTTYPMFTIGMQTPLVNNGTVTINGRIQVPDDIIKSIVVEYDTTRLFKTPKIVTVSDVKSPTGIPSVAFTADISNLDSEKIYYSRLKVTIGDEVVYGPMQLFSLTDKVVIIPTDVELYDSNRILLKALVHTGKQNVTGYKFLYGENSVLTDSIEAARSTSNNPITLYASLANLKPNTYYKGQFKGIANNIVILSKPFTFFNGTLLSNEPEKKSNMLVYPNPTNGLVKIVTPDKIIKKEIFKTDGALLRQITNDSDTIDISDLPTGLYILRVSTPRSIVSYKVIRQ
ncbi:T9SS type A sorting domain-containing protein [Emticicia fluvialis]|uniref:T9SS type A sorting domain-containing protein n=1 Tax=Emticicia fluvialis TaxID=2974474 RepID=UPI002165EEF2|nr:T9SS type A sorting domain-containing protein [Emticicia fluvialis]